MWDEDSDDLRAVMKALLLAFPPTGGWATELNTVPR